uniref:Uncharacterized protein n=1 Tax=Coccidioides posadasii RMSCC 3488 TaxID=454284 RepID=A0A0J6FKP1_COCPO|nr:hypothetical protein CPAG_07207 [Coccidioides posadasii RMSCC 3488]
MPQLGLSCGQVPDLLTNGERRRLKPGFTCLAAPGPRLTGHTTGAMYCTVPISPGLRAALLQGSTGQGPMQAVFFWVLVGAGAGPGGESRRFRQRFDQVRWERRRCFPRLQRVGRYLAALYRDLRRMFLPPCGQSKFPSSTRAGKGQCDRCPGRSRHHWRGTALAQSAAASCLTQRLEITAC